MIEHILQNKSIVEYLEKNGHNPVRELSDGRLSYLCPFSDHHETKPSFMVWTNSTFENFYCFGCQRQYHIIHLVSFLENISFKDALHKLSDGLEFTADQDQDYTIKKIIKEWKNNQKDSDLSYIFLSISGMCRAYLESVNHDKEECRVIDILWKNIDAEIAEFDFPSIETTLNHLPKMLQNRRIKFEKIKIERMKAQYAAKQCN